jgi:hypothetical protein
MMIDCYPPIHQIAPLEDDNGSTHENKDLEEVDRDIGKGTRERECSRTVKREGRLFPLSGGVSTYTLHGEVKTLTIIGLPIICVGSSLNAWKELNSRAMKRTLRQLISRHLCQVNRLEE